MSQSSEKVDGRRRAPKVLDEKQGMARVGAVRECALACIGLCFMEVLVCVLGHGVRGEATVAASGAATSC